MNIKEMLNRVLDVLKDNHTTWFYIELPKIDMEALRKKIIAILKDKHGGIGTIPDDEIEALADVLTQLIAAGDSINCDPQITADLPHRRQHIHIGPMKRELPITGVLRA
mgnify:CR=1 FL=1